MSVNVHDLAYQLERGMRESEEFKHLKEVYDRVQNDEGALSLFYHFRQTQFDLQQRQMMGQELSQEEIGEIQQLSQVVMENPLVSLLLDAEQAFSMLLADVNKIVMKPLEDIYGAVESE